MFFGWIIFFLILTLLYKTVGKTLYIYYIYKKRYGKDLIVLFFPVIGWYYFVDQSFKKYGDSLYFYKKLLRENPNAKAILALSGMENILTILDNRWVKKCIQNQQQFYKGDGPFGYNIVFGDGLLFKKKEEWKVQRQFLQGNFHFNALKERFEMFKECNFQFCSNVVSGNGEYSKIDYVEQAAMVSSDIISHSFLGQSIRNITIEGKSFAIALTNYVRDSFLYRISNPYFMLKAGLLGSVKAAVTLNSAKEKSLLQRANQINETIYSVITEREKKVKETHKTYSDIKPQHFLDLYLQEIWKQEEEVKQGKRSKEHLMTRHEIVNQYNTLIFAGTDTTSHLLVNILFEISRNPDVYSRLQKEIDQHIPSFENMKFDDLNKLDYLTLVIKETQRIYPAIFFLFGRVMDSDYADEDLYISKDLTVQIKLITQKQNEEGLFSEIDKFNPDRYQSAEKEDPFDFIPFSAGQRNCIGQYLALIEIKLGIIYALKKFHLKKNDEYQLKLYQEFVYSPVEKDLFYIKRK